MHEHEQEPKEQAEAEATADELDVRDEEARFITGWGGSGTLSLADHD
jgi:hypothetical protein